MMELGRGSSKGNMTAFCYTPEIHEFLVKTRKPADLFLDVGQMRIKPWKPNDETLGKNKICTISFSASSSYFLLTGDPATFLPIEIELN